MPTYATLIRDLGEQLGSFYEGTLTAGTTTLLTDTSDDGLQSPRWSADRWVDHYALITSGSASGQWRLIKSYDPDSGTLTPDDAYSATPGTASYELYGFEQPDSRGLGKYINQALKVLKYPTEWMVTEITNGDFEASTGTSNWTASSASLAEITAAANVLHGAKSLRITASGSAGHAQSDSVACTPGEQKYIEATVKVTPGDSARLTFYDVTNSTAIKTWDDFSGSQWAVMGRTFETIPAGCYQYAIRVAAVTSGDVIYVDNVQVTTAGRRFYTLPTTFDMMQQVYVEKFGSVDSQYSPLNRSRSPGLGWDIQPNATAANPYTLELKSSDLFNGGPVVVRFKRRFSALSATTDSTPLHQEFVLSEARKHAFMDRANQSVGTERESWVQQAAVSAEDASELAELYSPNVPFVTQQET